MDKPCKHCNDSKYKNIGAFEQECSGTCKQFDDYASGFEKELDSLLEQGNEILKRYGIKK